MSSSTAATATEFEFSDGKHRGVMMHNASWSPGPRAVVLLLSTADPDQPGLRHAAGLLVELGYLTVLPDLKSRDVAEIVKIAAGTLRHLRQQPDCLNIGVVAFQDAAEAAVRCAATPRLLDTAVLCLTNAEAAALDVTAATCPILYLLESPESSNSSAEADALQLQLLSCTVNNRLALLPVVPRTASGLEADSAPFTELLCWLATHLHANSGDWEITRLAQAPPAEADWWISVQVLLCFEA
jgi:hypothetical protein